MGNKPTYEELEQRVKALEKEVRARNRAEAALQEREEVCRLGFEHAVDAIFWADLESGLIINCNRAAEALLKKNRREIIGQHQTKLHAPDKAEFYSSLFRKHIEGGGSLNDEAEVITASGNLVPVHITASVTSVRGKRVIQGIFRDITQRKRTEEALRQKEKKYSTLVESSLTGIYIDQDEKIVFANTRFAAIYGYTKDELTGMESWRLVHPEDRAFTNEMRAKRLSGEDAASEYTARGLTKDQRTIWIRRRNTRIDYEGRPAILGNIADITEQKRAEEQLRNTNEALENFVHVVSHDLKTPIISIQGFSSRLLKQQKDALGEKGREYVQRIQESARRMELLVSELLALSRIGRVVSECVDVSSRELVEKVVSTLQDRLKAEGVTLMVAENLPEIHCDASRLYQVFENLLLNAVKYSGRVRSPRIEIGYQDAGEFHQFYVKDNGIGIDPKFHRKIFEMFYRLDGTEKEGSGVGLAIVERIVKHHGGTVWVESEKGNGATFYFTVPKDRNQVLRKDAGLSGEAGAGPHSSRTSDYER